MKTMKIQIVVLLILVLFIHSTYSQGLPVGTPEEVGISSERLDRINPVLLSYIDENKLPGMATLVARDGKVVHLGTYGKMRPDKAIDDQAIFRIASMTKPITSVAVMILYEEGHFLLDDPVLKYIPEFDSMKVFQSVGDGELVLADAKRPVTIHDLLTHTSGLTYGFFGNTPVDSMVRNSGMWLGDLEHMISTLGDLPLLFQPGEKLNYSVATDVLGYLVEVISGTTFDRFLEERIFGPLGMDETGFYVPEDKMDRVMPVYRLDKKGKLKAGNLNNVPNEPPNLLSGGGGLYSTISDYARFAQMMLNDGELEGARILGPKSVDLMLSNHLSEDQMNIKTNFPGVGFGLGFSVVVDLPQTLSIGSLGSAGWSGIYNTFFTIDPSEGLIFILMTQFSPFNYYKIQEEFKVLVYQSLMK